MEVPQAITREFIHSQPSVMGDLLDYVAEVRIVHGDADVAGLPVGLKRMLLIVDLDSEIYNGGFWQYFGNRTDQQGNVEDVEAVIEALNAMNATETAALVQKAYQGWQRFLAFELNNDSSGLDQDAMEAYLDTCNDAYYESKDELRDPLDAYIKAHEDEFVHSVS
jgi:hypothetical protein